MRRRPIDETLTGIHQVDQAAHNATGSNISYPNGLQKVRFANGQERIVLISELTLIDDCIGEDDVIPFTNGGDIIHVSTPTVGGNVTVTNALQLRAIGMLGVVGTADPDTPSPGDPTQGEHSDILPQFTFFIYDHLGNSRILYTTDLVHCSPAETMYILEHVLRYAAQNLSQFLFTTRYSWRNGLSAAALAAGHTLSGLLAANPGRPLQQKMIIVAPDFLQGGPVHSESGRSVGSEIDKQMSLPPFPNLIFLYFCATFFKTYRKEGSI